MRTVQVFLVRHTRTNWNEENRYSGQSVIPGLTQEGVLQAVSVGHALRHRGRVDTIFSSDLPRAYHTAAILGEILGLSPKPDTRLREVAIGAMDGLTKTEALLRFPAPEYRTSHPAFDFTPIGGESREDVICRHVEFFDQCVLRRGRERAGAIALVGHATSLRAFCQHLKIDQALTQGGFVAITYP